MEDIKLSFISNKTNARIISLLEFIERNNKFTLRDLSEKINVSERTIASDVKYLKDYFSGVALFSSDSKGYRFKEINFTEYKNKKIMLFENECLFEIIKNIFYGKLEDIDELAHKYSYSVTAFRRLLANSNTALTRYGLFWKSNPLSIAGKESSLRKFFKDFFYESIETPYTVVPDVRIHEAFITKGERYLGNYEIGTGTTTQSFYYTVYISMIRFSQGKKISLPKYIIDRVRKEEDFLKLSYLGKEIGKSLQIEFPEEELIWIFLISVCKRTIDRPEQEKKFYNSFNCWPYIEQVTEKFLVESSILQKDYTKIAPFLNSFFLSRKINDSIDPILNKEVLDDLEYEMITKKETFLRNNAFLTKELQMLHFSLAYFQEIIASFTIYSELIIAMYSSGKNIFFLLEGNHFICQSIRVKAQNLFGDKHNLKFVPLQLLTKDALRDEKIDLIVTNYDRYISDFIENQPFILVKYLPDEQDWKNIQHSLI